MNRFHWTVAAALVVLAVAFPAATRSQVLPGVQPSQDRKAPDRSEPVLFKAQSVRDDKNLGIVVATGNVELSQGQRTLLADSVSYNRRLDVVSATGNVSLLEPSGEVIFADRMELTGDMRDGVIENLRVRLADDARIAAVGGRRVGGNKTEFRKAVYSPCELCAKDPSRAPLWQVKAIEVEHDQVAKDIVYKDAFLEVFGVPVFYTPYFSHPDPTVERRTGFLMPTYGSDSDLGALFKAPYYIDIAPDKDATVTPIYTSNAGFGSVVEYRQLLGRGMHETTGSLIYEKDATGEADEFRGHVKSEFRYDINDTWRGGTDVFLTTDDTYLRRYSFESEDTLESRAFVEGFRGSSYAAANAYFFQGLRSSDDEGEIPLVFPMIDYNYVGEPGRFGGQWKIDSNLLALSRTQGTDTRRASVRSLWELPHTTSAGEVYRMFGSLQTDLYWANDLAQSNAPANTKSEVNARIFPQVGVDWRLPLARRSGRYTQTLEPMAALILAPDGQNTDRIPNEDSLSLEFDDTNLFSMNRFTGIDRLEGQPRISYGLRTGVFGLLGGSSSLFIGQSYRFTSKSDFGSGTGLEDRLSDYVGRIQIAPRKFVNALYRFRLDKDDLTARRNELTATAGVPRFRVSLNYLSIDQQNVDETSRADDDFGDREEIRAGLSSKLTDRWSAGISTRRDLSSGGGTLSHAAFVTYEDDCFLIRVNYSRSFTRDRDIEPTDTLLFRIVFKTLTELDLTAGAGGFGS